MTKVGTDCCILVDESCVEPQLQLAGIQTTPLNPYVVHTCSHAKCINIKHLRAGDWLDRVVDRPVLNLEVHSYWSSHQKDGPIST